MNTSPTDSTDQIDELEARIGAWERQVLRDVADPGRRIAAALHNARALQQPALGRAVAKLQQRIASVKARAAQLEAQRIGLRDAADKLVAALDPELRPAVRQRFAQAWSGEVSAQLEAAEHEIRRFSTP